MARCGCSTTCSCLVTAGDNVTVTGNGSAANPYVVSAEVPEMAASAVSYGGSTDLAATTVEAALDELDAEKAAVGHSHPTDDDQTAAQVPFTPYSTIAATNVQDAIEELLDEAVGGGGHVIEDSAGTDMTARANLQFTGAGVTVTDSAGNNRTVVTIPGGAALEDVVQRALLRGSASVNCPSGTPVTLTIPTSTQVGDLMVYVSSGRFGAPAPPALGSGAWTAHGSSSAGGTCYLYVYTKIAAAGDAGAVMSITSGQWANAGVAVWHSQDGTTPLDVAVSFLADTSGASFDTPAVAVTKSPTTIMEAWGAADTLSSGVITTPSGQIFNVSGTHSTLAVSSRVANVGGDAARTATSNHPYGVGASIAIRSSVTQVPTGTIELWHEIGAAGEPVFTNSWTNFGGSYETAAFYKDRGRVYFKGLIKSGTLNSLAFTLPVGYRPAQRVSYPLRSGGNGVGSVDIDTNGAVAIVVGSGNNTEVTISQVSFRVA